MTEQQIAHISTFQTKKGWGGYIGLPIVVSYHHNFPPDKKHDGQPYFSEEAIGLIDKETGDFSPPGLLNNIVTLKQNGVNISNETAAVLSIAKNGVPFLKQKDFGK